LGFCWVAIAEVTVQTFYLRKLDLLAVYQGKVNLPIFPWVIYLGEVLSSGAWICLEKNRVSLDSYPKAIARENLNPVVANQ